MPTTKMPRPGARVMQRPPYENEPDRIVVNGRRIFLVTRDGGEHVDTGRDVAHEFELEVAPDADRFIPGPSRAEMEKAEREVARQDRAWRLADRVLCVIGVLALVAAFFQP